MAPSYLKALVLFLGVGVIGAFGYWSWIGIASGLFFLVAVPLTGWGARASLRAATASPATALPPDDPAVPRVIEDEWGEMSRELEDRGFRWMGAVRRSFGPSGPDALIGSWSDEGYGTLLSSMSFVRGTDPTGPDARSVSTWFEDGSFLETTTLPDRPAVGPLHPEELACLPMLTDLRGLVQVHGLRLRERTRDSSPEVASWLSSDPVQAHVHVQSRFLAAAEKEGHLSRSATGALRPTGRGLVRATFRSVWPVRDLFRILERRRALALLAKLGLRESARSEGVRWAAVAGGVAAMTIGAAGALGIACWTYLGIAGAHQVQRRRERSFGTAAVLAGGGAGLGAILLFFGVPGMVLARTGEGMAGVELGLPFAAAFLAGAAALYWGWSGIPYLHAEPSRDA